MEQGRDLWLCLPDRKQLWLAAAVSICTTSESRSKTGLAFYMGLMVLLSCSNPPHTISRKPQQMDWGLARGVVGREHWLNGWCSIFSIHVVPYQVARDELSPWLFHLLQRCGVLENVDRRTPPLPDDLSVSLYLCEDRDEIAIHEDIKRLCKH